MLGLIIKREMTALLQTRSNQISFVVMLILIIGGVVIANFMMSADDDSAAPETSYVVGVEQSAADAAKFIEVALPATSTESIGDGEGEQWLTDAVQAQSTDEDNDITYAVVGGTATKPTVIFPNSSAIGGNFGEGVNRSVTFWIASQSSTITPDEAANAITVADSAYVRVLDLASDDNLIVTNPFGYFKALGVVILLATVILGGLATISTGVVEEKSSRVVEIILTSVKPRTLLLGKILGIGTVVIGQVACYIVVAFISLKIAGVPLPLLNLSSLAVWTILWSIVGFFTFSLIAGALAATVSRQEDLAPITSTLTMLTFIPIYGGFFLISAMPDATITKVLSYIPFMSSFMMPIRQSFGISSPTEQIIAFALGVAAIPLLAAFAGKLYRNSVLHSGKRMSIRQAWKQSK
ncbi:ABC transporter permease [Arcanobacterium buesumense]|uniref:ABC transporter permease n=1 Tax=Arcanobacterium buesumense TaxID=2722751 RepID=A0A6H2EMW1_9ACTO|nr:ABC transporter permease [Arcanobacterium buesumense]QJC22413.1 ABC transporter permease [Arcanobacterium buesumense]